MTVFTGQVTDAETGNGIPSATIEAWVGNLLLVRSAANGNGDFAVSTSSTPDTIKVTSVGYEAASYPFSPGMETMIPLNRAVKEEGNVTVTSHKLSPGILVGLGFLLLLLLGSKKR